MEKKTEVIEELQKVGKVVGLNDTFTFHCTQCGECCKHRHDIIMTPRDIYNAAKYLNVDAKVFVQQYCTFHIGPNSGFPVICLKAKAEDESCIMLESNKCRIHESKPFVCAAFPLGRAYVSDCGADAFYVLQALDCGDNSKTHTVKDWLESSRIKLNDEWGLKWNSLLSNMIENIRKIKLEDLLSQEEKTMVHAVLIKFVYMNYDINKDFDEQFDKNIETIKNIFSGDTSTFH